MNCDIINNFLIFAIILQKETSAMLHKGYRMLFICLMFYLSQILSLYKLMGAGMPVLCNNKK